MEIVDKFSLRPVDKLSGTFRLNRVGGGKVVRESEMESWRREDCEIGVHRVSS